MPLSYSRKPNPAHHNYGRLSNFNQKLSQRLAFVSFTAKGLHGNLTSARSQLLQLHRTAAFKKLQQEDQDRIVLLIGQMAGVAMHVRELADLAGDINRTKRLLPKDVR